MNFVRIDGFPNYVIHPVGTVLKIYKHKTREMKSWKDRKGYMRIALINNGKRKFFLVHRLLALHFIPNPENKPCIDHIDAVKDNNNLHNLEWVTVAENNRRRYLNNPRIQAEITKGNIYKRKNSWRWQYQMKGKQKSKTMKNREDLEKYRDEILKKYNVIL